MKYNLLDEIGHHFIDQAVKKVKEGKTFVYVLDNVDWMEKVHDMRSDAQMLMYMLFPQVWCLIVSSPNIFLMLVNKSLLQTACNMRELVSLTDEESCKLKERYWFLLARILCEQFPEFSFLQDLVPTHLPHVNLETMTRKSTVVPFPVLLKDETKYPEVVDVLD